MALQPNISNCNKNDCKTIVFTDITGSYSVSNEGGWGSPNIDLTDVASAIISVTLPNTENSIDLDVTSLVTSAIIVDGVFSLGEYTMEDFNSTLDQKFEDGIYNFTYTIVDNADEEYQVIKKSLSLCNVHCCLEKMKAKFKSWSCNKCDFEDNMMQYYKTKTLYQAITYAFKCGDWNKMNSLLKDMQKICKILNCSC